MSYGGSQYGPRRPRQDLSARLMLAAVIALVAIIGYYSKQAVNPVTGEKQVVGMSEEEEIALGLQAEPEMEQQFGGIHRDRRACAHVDQVGARLLKAFNSDIEEKGRKNPYRFKFHLLADDKTINAFALPGGQVFITFALYDRLETEGQLAGVLGHEVGHVISRHGAQQLAKQQLTQGLVGAAGAAGGTIDSVRMAQAVGQMVNLKYGRGDELEADQWGVKLMAQAGYDPRAMLGVMKILGEASQGGPPEFLSTHPKPANREVYIEEVLKKMFPKGVPSGLEP